MYEIIEKIIKVLVIKRSNPVINYTFFMDQLTAYYESNRESVEARNIEDFKLSAIPMLKKMEHEGTCTINYESSRIVSFQIHKYYRQLVLPKYKEIEERPDIPFPDIKSFNFMIDNNWILVFDIKTDFLKTMKISEEDKGKIVLIQFPEGIGDILFPPEILNGVLFDVVLKKLHLYIINQNNYAYIGRYLRKALPGNEMAVKKMMESVLSGPGNFKQHILKPGDFSFKFFSFLCNKVIKDLLEKNDKTASDIYTCQSLFILRAFVTHGRSLMQKETQKKADYKELSASVKKPPHIYSITEMYDLTDRGGKTYSSKYSREFINSFIKNETVPKEGDDLPYLVKIVPEKRKEYYIQRDMISQVFLRKIIETGKEVHDIYFERWSENLKKFHKTKEMMRDDVFVSSLEECIKNNFKFLNALLNPGLIYLANQSGDINENIKNSVTDCFAGNGKLKTVDKLLGIDRMELLKEIRINLPLKYSIPVIGKLLVAISSLFSFGRKGGGGNNNDSGETADSAYQVLRPSTDIVNMPKVQKPAVRNTVNYKNAISDLKKQYLESEKNIDMTLDELSEKWNPLYDATARKNLVEDVNSLVRDFIRTKKKLFLKYPPDSKRISALAEDLVIKTSNIGIKKKEPFRVYVELYIIKLLETLK